MNPNKIKHLEFIQNVISRMNSNSFHIKAWAVTLAAALFAVAAKDGYSKYSLIVYYVIPIFWGLDGFFLSTERKYLALYDEVRMKDEGQIDFNMDVSEFCKENRTWLSGVFSKTLLPFYGIIFAANIVIMWLLEV